MCPAAVRVSIILQPAIAVICIMPYDQGPSCFDLFPFLFVHDRLMVSTTMTGVVISCEAILRLIQIPNTSFKRCWRYYILHNDFVTCGANEFDR